MKTRICDICKQPDAKRVIVKQRYSRESFRLWDKYDLCEFCFMELEVFLTEKSIKRKRNEYIHVGKKANEKE